MNIETIEEFFLIRHTKNWFLKFERLISSISLFGGFIFDIYALPRVDEFAENAWIGAHLFIAAAGIILSGLFERKKAAGRFGERARSIIHFWLIMLMQFAFGGLLSAFLVFYFRSATLATSWPFFVLLGIAFIANEYLKYHFDRLTFQISFFYLSLYAYAIYVLPIVLHRADDLVFILSGVVSLVILGLFILSIYRLTREKFTESRKILIASIVGLTLCLNIFYFTNLIPPIPLSLKDAGVYHSLVRNENGNYIVRGELSDWKSYFRLYEPYVFVPGEPVFAYSAVFAPTNLNPEVVHVWEHYDESAGDWVETGRIRLSVIGGRDNGYRTYSMKTSITPGFWRVDVENLHGQVLGRIRFVAREAATNTAFTTEVK